MVAHIASKSVIRAFSQNNLGWDPNSFPKLHWCAETDFRADVECFDALLDPLDDLFDDWIAEWAIWLRPSFFSETRRKNCCASFLKKKKMDKFVFHIFIAFFHQKVHHSMKIDRSIKITFWWYFVLKKFHIEWKRRKRFSVFNAGQKSSKITSTARVLFQFFFYFIFFFWQKLKICKTIWKNAEN